MTAGRRPRSVLILIAALAHGPMARASGDAGLCHQAAVLAARETGVPLPILTAIMGAETGRAQSGGGAPEPWPWTLHAAGQGHWLADAPGARAALAALIAQGERNIDIGCFQINLRWHGAAFAAPADMLDPLANARHAARYLLELRAETGDWRGAAGAYHSRDPDRAEGYVRRVEAVHDRLSGTVTAAAPPPADPQPARPLSAGATVALIDLGRRLPPLGSP